MKEGNIKYPSIFVGHGSPMTAIEDNILTQNFEKVGREMIQKFGRPGAVLSISAHWFSWGQFVQTEEEPRQIYDMTGFPEELYRVKYPIKGDSSLGERVVDLLGPDHVSVNNKWGIDHGSWSVLCHMFPQAEIPVVQLSVDGRAKPEEVYAIGERLRPLREEGILLLGSGNIVHNLREASWEDQEASPETLDFDRFIVDHVRQRDDSAILAYEGQESASYAVPTPDHFYPLLYILGASQGDTVTVFNRASQLRAISMSSFLFG